MKTVTAYQTSDGRVFAIKTEAAYHERDIMLCGFFGVHVEVGESWAAARQAILDNHREFMEMMHAAPAGDAYVGVPPVDVGKTCAYCDHYDVESEICGHPDSDLGFLHILPTDTTPDRCPLTRVPS